MNSKILEIGEFEVNPPNNDEEIDETIGKIFTDYNQYYKFIDSSLIFGYFNEFLQNFLKEANI